LSFSPLSLLEYVAYQVLWAAFYLYGRGFAYETHLQKAWGQRLSLSQKERERAVEEHKKRILKATNKILDTVGHGFDDNARLQVRKLVNEVVSELSMIAGFCSSKEREWVETMSFEMARSMMLLQPNSKPIIRLWCTLVNNVVVDFTKTPFRFLDTEFNVRWSYFETKFKTLIDRRK
jgi:hypothetical protein